MRLKIKDIKCGDIFWEKSRKFKAVSDVRRTIVLLGKNNDPHNQYSILGKEIKRKLASPNVVFSETEGLEHYGPKLSDSNNYEFLSGSNSGEFQMSETMYNQLNGGSSFEY